MEGRRGTDSVHKNSQHCECEVVCKRIRTNILLAQSGISLDMEKHVASSGRRHLLIRSYRILFHVNSVSMRQNDKSLKKRKRRASCSKMMADKTNKEAVVKKNSRDKTRTRDIQFPSDGYDDVTNEFKKLESQLNAIEIEVGNITESKQKKLLCGQRQKPFICKFT